MKKPKIKYNVLLYCEKCEKQTEHLPKKSTFKDFMDGAFMVLTKGWSLMHESQLFECSECGNVVELEVE